MTNCQHELHQWGEANQVSFDSGKEGMYILSRKCPRGDAFKLLGVTFDCKLIMSDTVEKFAKTCQWKLKAILRTSRFNSGAALINLYKSQILSFIEYRTSAIYHACSSALSLLDAVQERAIKAAGASKIEALNDLNLAPLSVRRDIAMLGIIHRATLGRGPDQFCQFFQADMTARKEGRGKHRLQLQQLPNHISDFMFPGSRPADYIEYSAHGLIKVYNLLPSYIVEGSQCVRSFQASLQTLVRNRANSGCTDWELTLSPRVSSWRHPLKDLR